MAGFEITLILEDVSPVTERILNIPSGISFKRLHEIISVVFNLDDKEKYIFNLNDLKLEITDTGRINRDLIDSRYEKIDKYFKAINKIIYINNFWEITIKIKENCYDKDYPEIINIKNYYNPVADITSTNEFSEFIELKNKGISLKFEFNKINKVNIQKELMILFKIPYEIHNNKIQEVKTQKTLDKLF